NGRKQLLDVLRHRSLSQRRRIEALWALAARSSDDVDLNQAELFAADDGIAAAAAWLIASPVLPMGQDAVRRLAESAVENWIVRRDSAPVTGNLSYQGKPVAGAKIAFSEKDSVLGPVGETDDQGNFTLTSGTSVLGLLSRCAMKPDDALVRLAL